MDWTLAEVAVDRLVAQCESGNEPGGGITPFQREQ
jgi:hypothetical protein